MFKRTSFYIFLSLIAAVSLFGCTSATPDKDPEPDPGVVSPTGIHSYLSYKITMWDSVADKDLIVGIKALSLDNLSESVEVDVSADGSLKILPNGFQTGVYDGNSYSISAYHTSNVIYINEGKLKRLPVYRTEKPQAVQMSAESDAQTICRRDVRRANDYADPSNSRFVYKKLPGNIDMQDCQLKDGNWYMVGVSDSDVDIPQSLPQGLDFIVDAVHRQDDGGLLGWVVVENGQLKQYDVNFSQAIQISTNSGPIVVADYARLLTRTASKQFVLDIDNSLYIYNPYDHTVLNNKAVVTTQKNQRLGSYKVADGEKAFFSIVDVSPIDSSVTSSRLLSLELISGSSEVLATENTAIGKIVLTTDFVVYGVGATPEWVLGQRVRKISKLGGSSADINIPQGSVGVFDLYAAGEYFYVNHSQGKSKSIERIQQSELSGQLHNNHRIIGAIYGHVLNPAKFYLDIDYFVVIQDDPLSGIKRLHGIKVTSGEMFSLGDLPNDAYLGNNFEFIEALGHSHALIGIYHQGIRDLYYFDVTRENSLQRLGVHTEDNESGIYYKSSTK